MAQHNVDLGLEADQLVPLVQLDLHQPGVDRDPSIPAILVNFQCDD